MEASVSPIEVTVTSPADVIEYLKLPGALCWIEVADKDMTFWIGQPNGKKAKLDDSGEGFDLMSDLCPISYTGFIPDMEAVRKYEHDNLKQGEIKLKKPRVRNLAKKKT
jgi:hypothetical protein